MDPVLLVFLCAALVSLAVLCWILAVVAMRASRELQRIAGVTEGIHKNLDELKSAAIPVIERAGTVLEETSSVLQRVETDLDHLSRGASSFAQIAEDIRVLEQGLMARIRPSLEDAASLVSGVVKGVTTFARKLTDR